MAIFRRLPSENQTSCSKNKFDDLFVSKSKHKTESTELFSNVKKQYTEAPRTFGANQGKKEATLELLIIIGNQIAEEYKDLEVEMVLGVPELSKSKA